MNSFQKLFAVSAVALLSACSSTPDKGDMGTGDPEVTEDTAPGVAGQQGEGTGVEVIAAGGIQTGGQDLGSGQTIDSMQMTDVDSIHEPVIYFDYDQYDLDDQDTQIVRYHADILNENPRKKVVLNGHTDERGTPEYNLALGEKRGQAVAQAMMLFGVAAERIEVVSFGEEQPEEAGSNEAAWQKNRRVEIIIK